MKFYDAHIHFLYDGPANELKRNFETLENMGLTGMVFLVRAEFPSEMETVLKMIPRVYHLEITPLILQNQKNFFSGLDLTDQLRIMPFLDACFIGDHIALALRRP